MILAVHIREYESIPAPEADLTRDEILAALTDAKRRGVAYTFELYRGPLCEHCGKPASPFMRFARALPREAWIIGVPDDGSRQKLVLAIRVADPQFDPELAAHVQAELEAIVSTLNASEEPDTRA